MTIPALRTGRFPGSDGTVWPICAANASDSAGNPATQNSGAQPSGFTMRVAEGGLAASFDAGRIGRRTNSPPQFGQSCPGSRARQSAQKVHS